jgi:oligopeptide transport system ATP-binding protein
MRRKEKTMAKELLKVEGLCQYFGKHKAVEDVSFTVYEGEVFGLVGESGSGKTTTGRSIIGLYDISGGEIFFRGEKIRYKGAPRQFKKEIQMIFQDPMASLDPRMTVGESIAEGLIIRGTKNRDEIHQKVARILELVGLRPEHAGRYPHEFSGGQRQRIGIARAMIMEPALLIADEPVSALDVSVQAQVINLLNELRKKLGLTVLFIAHDLSVVKYFCDRVAVMHHGRILELASAKELFDRPIHPYTKSLLSAIPIPDPERERQRQRILYEPLPPEKRQMRQISPGHFVFCTDGEEKLWKN